jgi:hypothetical protein
VTGRELRLKLAIIQRSTRLLALPDKPFGAAGEMTEYGSLALRPDFAIKELLFGIPRSVTVPEEDSDGEGLSELDQVEVTVGDVKSFTNESGILTDAKEDQIELSIEAARDWIHEYLQGGWAV